MRRRLSYANVMATIAVFIALGGSSYAAVKITGKNVKNGSLTGADVKDGSLAGVDVKRGTIDGDNVADGSLLAQDFGAGQLPKGAPGPAGSKGATGARGPEGPKGDPGTVDTSAVYTKGESDGRYLGKADIAADAELLDGQESTDFLFAGAKAADADKLDGVDSSAFVQGGGTVRRTYVAGANVNANRLLPGFGIFILTCVAGNVTMQFQNLDDAPMSFWRERASTSALESQLLNANDVGSAFLSATTGVNDRITLEAANASGSGRWEAWIVASGGTCRFAVNETLG